MRQKILFWLVALMATLTASAQKYSYELGDKIVTDDGVYEVIGTNIISNGSFDDGTVGWIAGDGTDLSDSNFDVVQEGGAGSGSNKSVMTSWQITPGKTYLFSCWALRTKSGMSSNTQYSILYLANSDRGTNKEVKKMDYTADTWTQTTAIVEAGEYSYVTAQLGWLNAATSLDCFGLYEVQLIAEIVTKKLDDAIAAAESTMNSTEEGDGAGQYKTAIRQELQDAIDKAKGIVAAPKSQDEVSEAASELNSAVSKYKANVNPPFDINKKYNLVHYANQNAVMTTGGGTVKTANPDVEDKTQVFTFAVAPEGSSNTGYNLKDEEGNVVYRSGSWDTKASTTQDCTVANAIFQIVDLGGGTIQLKNMGSGSVLGTDGTSVGSQVYSDKNGGDSKFKWILKEYVPADQRDAEYNFNELLHKAESEYNGMSSKLGNNVFQYSKAAYEKYGAAIETAKGMSNFSAAIDYLQAAMDEYAKNAVNNPDPTAKYVITQTSGNNLSYAADNEYVVIEANTGGEEQLFNIIAAETSGAYYLKNIASGQYVAKQNSSAWNMIWNETTGSTDAQWYIAAYGDGQYTIQNVAGKGYIGSDATTSGSQTYCDKAASAETSHWTIGEYSISGVLDGVIATAEELAANTPVGNDYSSVPQSAMDAFLTAIEKAKNAKATATNVEAARTAAAELQVATNIFKESFNPLEEFDTDLTYKIVHRSGNVLTSTSADPAITALDADGRTNENQEMILEKAGTGHLTYYIKSAATGKYLAIKGDYNTTWQDGKESGATFVIEHLDGIYLGLHNTSKAYFGSDAVTSGSILYSDKAANNSNAYWTIVPVQNFDFTQFNDAITTANSYAESMVEGYKVGEYFASVISDFAKDINMAKAASKKANSQEEVDQMATDVLTLIETYKGKANATNRAAEYLQILVADCQAEAAAATVGVEKGQYTQANLDAFTSAIATASSNKDAEAAITKLKSDREDFRNAVNSVDRATLKSNIANAEKTLAAAVVGDANGNYPQEAYDALQTAIGDAKEAYNDITKSQNSIDSAVDALKSAMSDFTAEKVIIDYSTLKEVLTSAQKAITDCTPEKGEGPGTYPASAFTALQTAISKAQTFVNSTTANQNTVDSAADELADALNEFYETRVPNDYSELEVLLDASKKILAESRNIMAADDVEELEYAIAIGEAALKAKLQADIDRATKILNRDYQLYSNILTAVDAIMSGNASDNAKVYTLSGMPVQGTLQKGIYVITVNNISKKIIIK